MISIPYVLTDVGHALVWPALFSAIFCAALLGLITVAMSVALFAKSEDQANRALKVLRELLRVLRELLRLLRWRGPT